MFSNNSRDDKLISILFVVGALVWAVTQGSVTTAIIRIIVLLCCLSVHEAAHAFTAYKLGDPTARELGRVTLNPLKHLTADGTVLMLLFGFGYARPVPVNVGNFPPDKRKKYYALTALAGPASNILMAILFTVLSALLFKLAPRTYTLCTYILTAGYINISLAIFNLLPIPPLDGSSLLGLILPANVYYGMLKYRRYTIAAIFAVSFILHRLGISPLSFVSSAVFNFINRLVFLVIR